jgi:pyruvate/2-oxoglutarate dehydrogenase complex dihydrolipoamide acyltransferase (E2) component
MTELGPPPVPRRNKGLIAAITVAVLVLAVIGATAGWLIADRAAQQAGATGTPTPDVTAPGTSEPPVAEPSAVPTSAATNPGGFALPDVRGMDFERARRQLRDLGLGVQVFFAKTGDDRTVERTMPAGGQIVRRGTAIKMYVKGAPPIATIPNVIGVACNQAGSIAADHGFNPQYPSGRSGVVLREDPDPTTATAHWNDTLKLFCGPATSVAPSASAAP